LPFDRVVYARRDVIEHCIHWLRQWHGAATRYDHRVLNYHAMVVLAAIVIWLDP
jgi:transposase